MSIDYLDTLNPIQRSAVESTQGPNLILAGAGTGKTRVLVSRYAHILQTCGVWPSQILAVTFTNKAAKEMVERISALHNDTLLSPGSLWVGTFHTLCARILRRHSELVGLSPQFTILGMDDQQRLLKEMIKSEGLDPKKRTPKKILEHIQRWKDRALTPDKVPTDKQRSDDAALAFLLYPRYQERLQVTDSVDFGDLILLCLTIFQHHADVLAQYQERFKYIMVDEYQDTNTAQYLWLRLLSMDHKNICCVGDDDQSIYSWRGAEVGNILRFDQDFPGAQVFRLEQNYRSTPHILGAASALIDHNQGRLGKSLWTEDQDGEKVKVRALWDSTAEALFIGDEIESAQRNGQSLSQTAILVRTVSQMREFEERFVAIALPYRVVGGPRFYERAEIRDALAYFRLVVQPNDNMALERIINLPKRGIGASTMKRIHDHASMQGVPLLSAIQDMLTHKAFSPKLHKALDDFCQSMDIWRRQLASDDLVTLAKHVLDESGYTAMLQGDKTPEATTRLENLRELTHAMRQFETMPAFLEHVSLVMDHTEEQALEAVTIMTLHSAKGLEFDRVFLPGWEDGLFPHDRSLRTESRTALEEERRLAYVGLTRARQWACITHVGRRRLYYNWQDCTPSRFLSELPADHVEFLSSRGAPINPNKGGRFAGSKGSNSYTHSQSASPNGYINNQASYGQAHSVASQQSVETRRQNHVAEIPSYPSALVVGDRVFHEKFGYGAIRFLEAGRAEVAFEKSDVKQVMDRFLKKVPKKG